MLSCWLFKSFFVYEKLQVRIRTAIKTILPCCKPYLPSWIFYMVVFPTAWRQKKIQYMPEKKDPGWPRKTWSAWENNSSYLENCEQCCSDWVEIWCGCPIWKIEKSAKQLHSKEGKYENEQEQQEEQWQNGGYGVHKSYHKIPQRGPISEKEQKIENYQVFLNVVPTLGRWPPTDKALVRSKNLTALSLALSQKICARAHAQFLQDLALTLALKTFWAPLNFALILDLL